jgi:hypothetical protein
VVLLCLGVTRPILAAAAGLLYFAPVLCSGGAAASETVLAVYVLLGPSASLSAQAQARVIVPGNARSCPELRAKAERVSMSFRDNPHGFSVKVCEAIIPLEKAFEISWIGQKLPVATRNPTRILLFGDTGCYADDCSSDETATPFGDLARTASELMPPPELVIHVGDYNYRGTPGQVEFAGKKLWVYDAGDGSDSPACQLDGPYVSQNAGYSKQLRDSWENWRLDFFEPARDLLATAPFVFARGNHELCSRAGPGWFYFLDPSTNLEGGAQLSCPLQGAESTPVRDVLSQLVFTPPRSLDLGKLRLLVLDSANACDEFAPDQVVRIYREQLQAFASLPDGKPVWVISHRPLWGIVKLCPGSGTCPEGSQAEATSRTLQAALNDGMKEASGLPPTIRLFVSGHMHLFQSVTFGAPEKGFPPQIIVGNGGVRPSAGFSDGPFTASIDGVPIEGLISTKHGFTIIDLMDADGTWKGEVVNPPEMETIANCQQPVVRGSLCMANEIGQESLQDPERR